MPAKIILNPYSNRWGAGQSVNEVVATLHDLDYDFDLVQTAAPGEAIELARQAVAQGYDPVVAAGGDGAISEVVNGLLAEVDVAPVRLGVIPLGSANDYAYQLGIPLDIKGSCRNLVAAEHVRTLDAGRCNDRVFQNDITIAFGAQVNIEAATIKRLRGSAIYLGGVFKALAHYKLPTVTIEWDEGKLEDKPILLAYVGNGWRTGGVFHLAPDAILDDGFLDFIVGDAMGRLSTLRLLPKTFNGSHIDDPHVFQTRFRRLRLTSDDPLPVLSDGEIIYRDAHDLDIRILPGALRVIAGPEEGERPR
ncbi:MAG TPA: diacylglycerol kinase family lipid kinase [Caldilineae bacterium]|nr:diacylglycerol kinase family lipid kinase [Caldilineae bacterium]